MRCAKAIFAVLTVLAIGGCSETGSIGLSKSASGVSDEMRRVHLSIIQRLNDQGKSQAALAFLDDYDLRFPNDPEARTTRGEALLRIGRTDDAEKVFRTLYDAGYRPAADFGLGQVQAAKGDWREAARYFGNAARMAPTNVRYLNNYGYSLLKCGRQDEAYQALARATQLDPKDKRTRNNYLLAAMLSGREDEARQVLDRLKSSERASLVAFVKRWTP